MPEQDKFFYEQSDIGKQLREQGITPRANFAPTPSQRDRVMSALMAFQQGTQAAQKVAPQGDAFGSFLAGATGGLGAPSAQDLANKQAEEMAKAQMAQFEATPIDEVSPEIVQAHPELKGIPLGMIQRMAPFIEKADKASRVVSRPMAENIVKTMDWLSPVEQNDLANRISGHLVDDVKMMLPSRPSERADTSLTAQEQAVIGKSIRGEKITEKDLSGVRPQVLAQLSLKPVPLSAEAAKASANAMSGIRQIDVAMDIVKRGLGGKVDVMAANMPPGMVGDIMANLGSEDAQTLRNAVKEAGDVITRLRTGAALNTQEEKYYGNLLLGVFRGKKANINSLKVVQDFLKDVENQIRNGRRIPGLVENGQPTFLEGTGPLIPQEGAPAPGSGRQTPFSPEMANEAAKILEQRRSKGGKPSAQPKKSLFELIKEHKL